jgi:uncharacterized protein YpmB
MEKTCDIIKDLLPLYLDNVCSEDSKRAVEEHIATCENCRRELEAYRSDITAADGGGEEVIRKLSTRWKKTKRASLLTGILVMAIFIVVGISALFYSYSERPVRPQEVAVEELSILKNTNVYFTLRVSERVNADGMNWFEQNGNVYITLKTDQVQLKKKKGSQGFEENTANYSRWEFNTRMSGIKNIYLYDSLDTYENGKDRKTLIWSNETELKEAGTEAETWIRTYSSWGNVEPGLLAKNLHEHRNPYVGDMPANGKILNDLKVAKVLGNFKNELQTTTEPYGYTLLFEDTIQKQEIDEFDSTMKSYACVMLAMIDNLSEVSWKYTAETEKGETEINQSITKAEAGEIAGSDIKSFSDSASKVQNLLYILGIEK